MGFSGTPASALLVLVVEHPILMVWCSRSMNALRTYLYTLTTYLYTVIYLEAVDADAAAPTGDQASSLKGTEADAAGMVVCGMPCNHKRLQHKHCAMKAHKPEASSLCSVKAGKSNLSMIRTSSTSLKPRLRKGKILWCSGMRLLNTCAVLSTFRL